jgi:hypothetical protein
LVGSIIEFRFQALAVTTPGSCNKN